MIVVVGAGLTGLALAHELRKLGAEHLVLEAADRPGGVIRSGRIEGHLLEWGPQRTRLTKSVDALVEELGLGEEVLLAPPGLPLYVYSRGKLRRVPFSVRDFLTSDIFTWGGKARILLEPFTAGPREAEPVASYFTRKLGRQVYENLLGPLYGGLYASDPADMEVDLSLQHVLREFRIGRSLVLPLLRRGGKMDPPPATSFREGMQALTAALHERNRDAIRLGTAVHGIARRNGGYRVETRGGGVDAEQVVVASPAPAASRILAGVAPDAATRIGQLNYNPLAVVHLHAETELSGLGYQVSLAESLFTRGVTFNDSLFGRRGIYTVYLGGAKAPEVVGRSERELGEIAVSEFRLATGYDARPLSVERERMPAWDRSWRVMQGITVPRGIHLAANWESRPGIPGRLHQAKTLAARLVERGG